jgi:hypothetical protein
MKPSDLAAAERAAAEHWDELLEMTNPEQRQQALRAAVEAFDESLSEQGCWIPDALARMSTLERAIEEYLDALDESLADTPTGPVH